MVKRDLIPMHLGPKVSPVYEVMLEEFKERQARIISKYGVKKPTQKEAPNV